MSLWTEITNTALIGCERKPLSIESSTEGTATKGPSANGPSADRLSELLSQLDQNDREGALLGAAAIVSLYERAGSLPSKDARPLPDACAPDDAPRCSEQSARQLSMMLRGEYQELLPEWLEKVALAGQRAPEELAPPLLDHGRMREDLRKTVLPALGERGRWLAAQNPSWNYNSSGLDETCWETGGREQRLAFLAELRRRDAAPARELLASTWAQESPKDRVDFLAALENGLSPDDEAFLEASLDDRRKEVRRAAADLLARLPESELCQRMIERARPLLAFKLNRLRRRVVEITLPESCDKKMQRDGIEPKPFMPGIGEKAWWLQQILSLIPPTTWARESGWTMNELIEVAKRSDWKSLLLEAWSQAARLYRDADWADALLVETYKQGLAAPLFQVLPHARQEFFVVEMLKKDPSLQLTNAERVYIESCRRPWSVALSRAVIDGLLRHMVADGFNQGWMWTSFMATIVCRLDPALIPETISRLTESARQPEKRAPALEHFLDFLQFRHDMLKEFN